MSIQKTRDEIINRALTLIGAKATDEPAKDEDVNTAADALNDLVKVWQASGAHLWSRNDFTLFLQPGQVKYQLGGDTSDHATESFSETTLAADVASGSRVITLTDSTGLSVGDRIGIAMTGGLYWDTIDAVTPQIVLSSFSGVPADIASGATVFFYSSDIGKALRIPDARRILKANEIMMIPMGRNDYLNLPNKTTSGTPVQFYYDPKKELGYLYLWPAPVLVTEYISGTYYKPLGIANDADDEADFPDEWVMALKYNLAVNIAPDVAGGIEVSPRIVQMADKYYQDALDFDQGDAPVHFAWSKQRKGG